MLSSFYDNLDGEYYTEIESEFNKLEIWNGLISKKDYLISVLEGSYRTVRILQEEVNELKAPTAAYGAQGEEITIFMIETIN